MLLPNPERADCKFYHSFDFPGIGHVPGDWDLRGRFDEYIGWVKLKGKTFLDVGTASGFHSFEAEKRHAATVTSFDSDSASNWQVAPGDYIDEVYYNGMRNSYTYAHRVLNSQATPVYGNVYEMSRLVKPHDVVLVAQILVHLRDPLGAIEQAARCAKETLIIVEGMYPGERPTAHLTVGDAVSSWWYLSRGIYRKWLRLLGFEIKHLTAANYTCLAEKHKYDLLGLKAKKELSTLVATRVAATQDPVRWSGDAEDTNAPAH